MTEEYKNNILAYLVGKMPKNAGNNIPILSEIEETPNNLLTNLQAELKNQGHEIDRLYVHGNFQSKNSSYEGLDKTILYGDVRDTSLQTYGWLAILDDKFNLIQVITKYSSGIDIRTIDVLDVDEEGNLMGIEMIPGTGALYTRRFLLLNNPTIKSPQDTQYQLKIKKSYILPDDVKTYNYTFIKRRKDGGNYLLAGTTYNGKYTMPIAVELKINVGSENEWTTYNVDSSFQSVNYSVDDVWANWGDNDILDFQMIGYTGTVKDKLSVYSKDNSNISLNTITMFYPFSDETTKKSSAKIQKKDDFYSIIYSVYNNNRNSRFQIFHIYDNLSGRVYKQEINLINYSASNDYSYLDIKINGYDINVVALCTNAKDVYIAYIGRIENENFYSVNLNGISQNVANPIIIFNVNKQFNLYNYQFQVDNYLYSTYEIYNKNNYNGLSYVNVNSMVPNQGILYDSQNKPIFARNLYNKVITGRSTNSSIQVPNTYLNDVTIAKQNLLSETNSILISNNQTITKNIYETLNINFINTLQIKNDNDETNSILNPAGASRLNNSISETTDYDNTKALKIKINYTDNTNYILQLKENQIDKISDTSYMYDFDIYVSKSITNIQIISNDETTIYQTITSTFEVGKFYNITQMVEIV